MSKSKEETKRISVSIAQSQYKEMMHRVLDETGGTNASAYVSKLIEKDLKQGKAS